MRGQQTARLVAQYLQPIAPGCEATPSAYAGNDIKNIGWDVEVKAPRDEGFSPRAALRQACKRRKPEHILPPMVVLRPDGTGDASVGEFIVFRRFEDDRAILDELLALRRQMQVQHEEISALRHLACTRCPGEPVHSPHDSYYHH